MSDFEKGKEYPREFTITEIFSVSWNFFARHYKTILLISLCVHLPLNVITAFMPELSQDIFRNSADPGNFLLSIVPLLAVLIGFYSTPAIAIAVHNLLYGGKIDFVEALKRAAKVYPQALATDIFIFLPLLVSFILMYFGGFFFILGGLMVVFSAAFLSMSYFSIFAAILRDKYLVSGVSYSISLVRGRFWRTTVNYLGLLFLMAAAAVLFFIFKESVPELGALGKAIDVVFGTALSLGMSYFTVALTMFFINFEDSKDLVRSKK